MDDWAVFIKAYERTTAACGYTDDENVTRLQHALNGPALEVVKHLLSFPDGLNEAIETLKSRYGRPDLIVESVIRKIRCMAAPKMNDLPSLVEFGFAVKRLLGAVRASGLHAYMYDVTLLKELVKKLPPVICIDWAWTTRRMREVTLMEFGRWIGELASDLCRVIDMTPVLGGHDTAPRHPDPLPKRQQFQHQPFQNRRSPPDRFQPSRPIQMESNGTGRAHPAYCNVTVLQEKNVSDPTPQIDIPVSMPACVVCGESCGSLSQCEKFMGTTVAARRAFVNERRMCRKCLGYHAGKCRAPPCGVDGYGVQHY